MPTDHSTRRGSGAYCLLMLMLLALALPLTAQDSTSEGALFLLLPSGAQGVGLGRAMTAMTSPEAAFWNPAGLASLDRGRATVLRGEHVAGEATGFAGVHVQQGLGTFGMAYQLLDLGTFPNTDDLGNVLGSTTFRNHQAILSAARAFTEGFRAGANVKVIRFRQSCRGQCPDGGVSATSWALDLGTQLQPLRDTPLTIGVLLAHLGPDFRIDDGDQADPLPARVRVAVAYELIADRVEEDLSLTVTFEAEDRLRHLGELSFYFGSEFVAGDADQVFLRGGYVMGDRNDVDGAAVGFGVRYERFELGIARSLARGGPVSASEPVHVTLGVAF